MHEASSAIRHGLATRVHGMASQVPADVVREFARRGVPFDRILAQRFGNDRVEVTSEPIT